jgi:hypothetical protein
MTSANKGFTTTILHHDRQKSIEHGSVHKPVHTAVMYGYKDARELADVFQGKASGYRYGRQGNPTVSALEEKLTSMEAAKEAFVFQLAWRPLALFFRPCCVRAIILFHRLFCSVTPTVCGKPLQHRACRYRWWTRRMSGMCGQH